MRTLNSKHWIKSFCVVFFAVFFTACLSSLSFAEENATLPEDLTAVSLEDLLSFDIEVTSILKKKQKLIVKLTN